MPLTALPRTQNRAIQPLVGQTPAAHPLRGFPMRLTRKVTRAFFIVAGGLSLSIGSLNSQCSAQLGLAVC